MIFESNEIERLRKKYLKVLDFKCPQIIQLDRSEDLKNEKKVIDNTILKLDSQKQKSLFKQLCSKKGEHYIGAWFEIMFNNWLAELGEVKFEPLIHNDKFDFYLKVDNVEVLFEAHVIAKNYTERAKIDELKDGLKKINKPYLIGMLECKLESNCSIKSILKRTEDWLSDNPNVNLICHEKEYDIHLYAIENPTNNSLIIIESRKIKTSSENLKNPLHKKARQHKSIHEMDTPYILAFLLDEPTFTIEEVINAWYGNVQIHIDKKNRSVLGSSFDKSGLHFFGFNIQHKSVTGTLVFKRYKNPEKMIHEFDSWYIQNRYARTKIDYSLFPTKKNFIVLEKCDGGVYMGWDR